MGELGQRQAAQQGGRCGKELFSLLMSSALISLFMHLSTKKVAPKENSFREECFRNNTLEERKTTTDKDAAQQAATCRQYNHLSLCS